MKAGLTCLGVAAATVASGLVSRPVIVLALSGILAVVLLVLVWRRAGGTVRAMSPLLLIVTPLVTIGVLSLPSDECSDSAKRGEPAYACRTSNE